MYESGPVFPWQHLARWERAHAERALDWIGAGLWWTAWLYAVLLLPSAGSWLLFLRHWSLNGFVQPVTLSVLLEVGAALTLFLPVLLILFGWATLGTVRAIARRSTRSR